MYIHTYLYIYMYIHIHIYIYIYKYINIHVDSQLQQYICFGHRSMHTYKLMNICFANFAQHNAPILGFEPIAIVVFISIFVFVFSCCWLFWFCLWRRLAAQHKNPHRLINNQKLYIYIYIHVYLHNYIW